MKGVDETKKQNTPLCPWELREMQTPYESQQGPSIWTAFIQGKTDENDTERRTSGKMIQ